MSTFRTRAIALGVHGLLAAADGSAAAAGGTGEVRQTQGFRKAVTLEGVRAHQQAF